MNKNSKWGLSSLVPLCAMFGMLAPGCVGAEAETELEDAAELEQWLNSDVSTCGYASADKTYSRILPSGGFTTPSNYAPGKNGCGMAYFVDVNDYRVDNASKFNGIAWGDTVPTTRAACEASRLMVYAFDKTNPNATTFVEAHSSWGSWHQAETCAPELICDRDSYCNVPRIHLESSLVGSAGTFNLTSGRDYKFAISARNTAPTPDAMKKIRLYSGVRQRPPR